MFIVAFLITVLAFANWRRFRDVLYPGFLQSIIWVATISVLLCVRDDFNKIGIETWMVLLAGTAAFSVGAMLSTTAHEPQLAKNSVDCASKPWPLRKALVFIIPLLALPLFVRAVQSMNAQGMSDSLLRNVRDALGEEDTTLANYGYVLRIAFLAAGLATLNMFTSVRTKLGWLLLVVSTVVALVYAILFTGRNFIVFLVLIIAGVPLILRRVSAYRIGVALLVFAVLLFAVYAVLLQQAGLGDDDTVDNSKVLSDLAALYVVGPIVALDTVVRQPPPLDWGLNSFRNVVLWLNRVGYDLPLRPIAKDYVPVTKSGWTVNIYTSFHPLYLDFGITGVLVFQFIAGCWHGYVYRRATEKHPSGAFVLLYAIFLLPLLMQVEVDYYLAIMMQWVFFVAMVSFLYVGVTARPTHVKRST